MATAARTVRTRLDINVTGVGMNMVDSSLIVSAGTGAFPLPRPAGSLGGTRSSCARGDDAVADGTAHRPIGQILVPERCTWASADRPITTLRACGTRQVSD